MNRFITGMNTGYTEKGGNTFLSSGNPHLDFLFHAGTARSDEAAAAAVELFRAAFADDPVTALRVLFFVRSVRKGLGERKVFRTILRHIANGHFGIDAARGINRNLSAVAEHGRFDDYDALIGGGGGLDYYSMLGRPAVDFWLHAIASGNRLAAKWAPRETNRGRRLVYNELLAGIGKVLHGDRDRVSINDTVLRRAYRKAVSKNSDTVEQKMSDNAWGDIEYSHVPSIAVRKYRNAFAKHDPVGWTRFILDLQAGKTKVNTGSSPGDLVKHYNHNGGLDRLLEQQWLAMLEKLSVPTGIIPMVDTSGSMFWTRGTGGLYPIDHAVGIGLAITNSQPEPWKGVLLSFNTNPTLNKINTNQTLEAQSAAVRSMSWGGTTNIHAGFERILQHAVLHKVSPEEMPEYLIVLSDMEFDQASGYSRRTSYQAAEALFQTHGYELPIVIFWNLAGSQGMGGKGNVPVLADDNRTVLISGYSVNALEYIFNLDNPARLIDEINETMSDIVPWYVEW